MQHALVCVVGGKGRGMGKALKALGGRGRRIPREGHVAQTGDRAATTPSSGHCLLLCRLQGPGGNLLGAAHQRTRL